MIDGISGPRATQDTRRTATARTRRDFRIDGQASTPPTTATDVTAASLGGMLALQEEETDAVRDREARGHGEDLLRALGGLQRDLLAGEIDPVGLQRLATLAASLPQAADGRLRGILAAVALRARVELARYRDTVRRK